MAKKKINLKIKQADGSFEHLIPITNMDAVMDVNGEKTLTEVLENDYANKQYVDDNKFSGDYNDLENRPCYDDRIYVDEEFSFDGNLEEKESVNVIPDSQAEPLSIEGPEVLAKFIKITDKPSTLEEMCSISYIKLNDGIEIDFTNPDMEGYIKNNIFQQDKALVVPDFGIVCITAETNLKDAFEEGTIAESILTPGLWTMDIYSQYPVEIRFKKITGELKPLDEKFILYKPGKNVTGELVEYYDRDQLQDVQDTAQQGAEIFNNYETNIAFGEWSHAEGRETQAIGSMAHAEGSGTLAYGRATHSEGDGTLAIGDHSHSEGLNTQARGYASHTEGEGSKATGNHSHAEGDRTIASAYAQHVQGKYNIEDTENKYAHIVGNGDSSIRSNAHTLDWDGNAWFQGNVSVDGTPTNDNDLTTKKYVDESVANLVNSAPETLDTLNELATALGNDENFATNVTNNIANKVNKPEVNGTEGQVLSLDGQGNTVWADAGIDEDELNNMLTDTFGFSEND